MDLTATAATAQQSQSQADTAGARLATDFSQFMTLLTTQLQNQDPMDPMDSAEFTNQLVAFAGVEQQIVSNKNLENLTQLTQLSNLAGAASYLGQEAVVQSDVGTLDGGDAVWDYQINLPAESVTLKVYDAGGKLVHEQPGDTKLGTHEFVWEGFTSDGSQLTEGAFRLKVEAKNEDGDLLSVPIYVTDRIVSLETTGETPLFMVGSTLASQHDILALSVGAKNVD